MAQSNKNILLIVGGLLLVLVLVCGGVFTLIYSSMSSYIEETTTPTRETTGTFDCPDGPVTAISYKQIINWLEGASHTEARLVVGDIEIRIHHGRRRDWIPEEHLPPHRVDGDATESAFEIFLDPALFSPEAAGAVEGCLDGQRQALVAAIRATAPFDRGPTPPGSAPEEGVIYWRGTLADVEPTFRHANGERITVGNDGYVNHAYPNGGTLAGIVSRQEDGGLQVRIRLGLYGTPTTPVAGFFDSEGRTIEQYFGVPIETNFTGI